MSAPRAHRRPCRAAVRLAAALLLVLSTAVQAAGVRLRTLDGVDTTLADVVPAERWTLVMIYTTYCGV